MRSHESTQGATAPNFGNCQGCATRIQRRVCRRTEASFMRRHPCRTAVAAPRQIGKAALRHGNTRKVESRRSKVGRDALCRVRAARRCCRNGSRP
ncbi:MAG: hypothetical protein ILM98_10725 [Kiritimatiellae bacterium]|nr:hypothetical protein [Kiritimatiellia bacterium]